MMLGKPRRSLRARRMMPTLDELQLTQFIITVFDVGERPEKPQRGNPHELTVRQHVFPRASIARFVEGGGVDVADIKRGRIRRAGPDDDLFCANRAWAHGPESGWMKVQEDQFQVLAELILHNRQTTFDESQSDVISEFYALWRARGERRHLPMQTIGPQAGVIGMRRNFTHDELELLEKNGISAFRGDGSIQTRHLMGPVIRLAMDQIRKEIADRSWSLVSSQEGEFCVPDVPAHGVLPLTPTLVLHINRTGPVSKDEVAEINRAMVAQAQDYVFARSIGSCPGVREDDFLAPTNR